MEYDPDIKEIIERTAELTIEDKPEEAKEEEKAKEIVEPTTTYDEEEEVSQDSFDEGDIIEIKPTETICDEIMDAKVTIKVGQTKDFVESYIVEFLEKKCPPTTSEEGLPLSYWVAKDTSGAWILHVAYSFDVKNILTTNVVPLIYVRKRSETRVAIPYESLVKFGDVGTIEPDLSIPTRPIIKDQKKRDKIQNEIFERIKPRIIRNIEGGLVHGMGIRAPFEFETKKTWLDFEEGEYIKVQINITHPKTNRIVSSTILFARIVGSHEKSSILNRLGKIYELQPIDVFGAKKDIFAFTPLEISGLKIKYWLGVYYDLNDCKIMGTTAKHTYQDIEKNIVPGRVGEILLAEYPIGDIKRVDSKGVITEKDVDIEIEEKVEIPRRHKEVEIELEDIPEEVEEEEEIERKVEISIPRPKIITVGEKDETAGLRNPKLSVPKSKIFKE